MSILRNLTRQEIEAQQKLCLRNFESFRNKGSISNEESFKAGYNYGLQEGIRLGMLQRDQQGNVLSSKQETGT